MSENNLESIHKICPIFGSHLRQTVSQLKGIHGAGLVAADTILSLCVREKCQLWEESMKHCSITIMAQCLSGFGGMLPLVHDTLDGIEAALRDLKEAKNGDS